MLAIRNFFRRLFALFQARKQKALESRYSPKKKDRKRRSASLPVDETQATVADADKESSGEVSERSSRFSRLLDLSERVGRKVKTFVSRPIRPAAMKRFVKRVRARITLPRRTRELETYGEVAFPRTQRLSSERRKEAENIFVDATQDTLVLPSTSVAAREEQEVSEKLESGCPIITGNKDNNGQVLIGSQPFWMRENEVDVITADDLQLNAEVVLDVDDGKIVLETMPKIPVLLNPFNDLKVLKKRDGQFFTRGLLFGNSVRSMINLSDMTSVKIPERKRMHKRIVDFTRPSARYFYERETHWDFEKQYYVPQNEDAKLNEAVESEKPSPHSPAESSQAPKESRKEVSSNNSQRSSKKAKKKKRKKKSKH
ncbi:unnamed protein product [Cylicocyclus nassatus]|uniref:Uncharacterized protein n=1 Tax=Cylicocyclus nassatus TaxID=53992 RepID=A0AA36DQP5_CYLNA|nr:unnamed protein product [Cylicocyclus nassatus]